MHPSTVEALRRYRSERDLSGESAQEDAPFFVGTRGRRRGLPLGERQVHRVFAELRQQLGLAQPRDSPRPAHPRSAAHLRRAPHRAVAGAGRRYRSGDAVAVDLRRACDGDQHLLVPLGGAGADGAGRRALRVVHAQPEVPDA